MSARKQDAKTKRTFARMDAVKADAERAVAAFMSAWDRIDGKGWPYVPPTEVEGYVLLALCEALCKRIDGFQSRPPDALLKLSNALADYRDSGWINSSLSN